MCKAPFKMHAFLSSGSDPGPCCYGRNGPLTITDANVLLGRIQPHTFPHIFGPTQDMPLHAHATMQAFDLLTEQINKHLTTSSPPKQRMSYEAWLHGCVTVMLDSYCYELYIMIK
jgi:5-oxoprolinase (ATP-hydrolysing)